MNYVGNIFTILILLLSVCFLMIGIIVNAAHQNWKTLAMENKAKVETYVANRNSLLQQQEKKDTLLEKEKVYRMLKIQQLESQLQTAREEFGTANEELRNQRLKAQENFKSLENSVERIGELDKRVATLAEQLKTRTEDVARQRDKVLALTTQLYESSTIVKSLEKTRDDLSASNALANKVLKIHDLAPTDLVSHIPRKLDGLVTKVDEHRIAINLGMDDGLLKGHRLDIFRDGRYVGAAKVTAEDNNMSVARIDRELTKIPVQVGDRVTTQWVREQD